MQNYRNLLVWQRAHGVALEIQRLTATWRGSSNAGLVGQARRAAASIAANVVEGSARFSDRDFARFVTIAIGSTVELEYHCEFAADAGVMEREQFKAIQPRIIEIRRMLVGLRKRLVAPPAVGR